MSGFVVVINQDGAPASPNLLRGMTDYMEFRGPDAREIWTNGNVGLGHAMLRTTFESGFERQPFSLDGQVWITADARVDGRAGLIRRLAIEKRDRGIVTDSELILRAYLAWGEDCVESLIGDFAFAIWDERKRLLFCARDHFGVKPFYYSQPGEYLILSNTLDCVRLHPAVSDELNERAIGDFLLVESNQDPNATFFADIQKLPAASALTYANGALKIRRYWSMPIEDEIRYKRESEYVDHFVELLDESVSDRLRTDRVGISMSGGMDSSTVAATANKALSKQSTTFDLRAFTTVYDHMLPDQERYYSGLVAEKLKIPIQYLVTDDYGLYERFDQPELRKPEPAHAPFAAISNDLHRQISTHSRVSLTGEGGDSFLRPSVSYILNLLKDIEWGRLLADVYRYIRGHRRIPRIGFRTRLRRQRRKRVYSDSYPEWLNPGFESRLKLTERWEQLHRDSEMIHPRRPEAYESLTSQFWPYFFERFDPGVMRLPLEVRHPLFDLRLVNYSLRLPSLPWCSDKYLMRMAMRGILPEQARRRTKSPLAGDPILTSLQQSQFQLADHLPRMHELTEYIDPSKWMKPDPPGVVDLQRLWAQLRPVSLHLWLKASQSSGITQSQHLISIAV